MRNVLCLTPLLILAMNGILAAKPDLKIWGDIKAPQAAFIIQDSLITGVAVDMNLAVNHFLTKVSFSQCKEEWAFSTNFVTPKIEYFGGEASFGYIWDFRKLRINCNAGLGYARYVLRGELIPNEPMNTMSFNMSRKYQAIRSTAVIYNCSVYGTFLINNHLGIGSFIEPLSDGQFRAIVIGCYLSIGRLK